jgi:hypothetical protein
MKTTNKQTFICWGLEVSLALSMIEQDLVELCFVFDMTGETPKTAKLMGGKVFGLWKWVGGYILAVFYSMSEFANFIHLY